MVDGDRPRGCILTERLASVRGRRLSNRWRRVECESMVNTCREVLRKDAHVDRTEAEICV
ncbi:hypothetical protein PYCCODRAFT_1429518 [Trametes coccinea BRFM310]|uniref:Uncharacterized protein n=1 Tax=Trametes coccinea (strain BRFM310) TaxID=1353009 RepID=A0A1Y2J543_TRAC3|nr:hypothetical protein PYCCODRAFT_1429518 [Trametes coccinea BRFM310]